MNLSWVSLRTRARSTHQSSLMRTRFSRLLSISHYDYPQSISLSYASEVSEQLHGYQKYLEAPSDTLQPIDLGRTSLLVTGKTHKSWHFLNGHAIHPLVVTLDDIPDESANILIEEGAAVGVSMHSEDSLDEYNLADYADLAYAADERDDSPDPGFEILEPVEIPRVVPSSQLDVQGVSQAERVPTEKKIKKKKASVTKEEPKAKEKPVSRKVPAVAPNRSSKAPAPQPKIPSKSVGDSRKPSSKPASSGVASMDKPKKVNSSAALRTSSEAMLRPKSSVEPAIPLRKKANEVKPTAISSKLAKSVKEDRLTSVLLRKSFGIVGAIKSDAKKSSEKAARRSS